MMSEMLYQLSGAAYDSQTKGMQIMVDSFINKLMSTMGMQFEKLGESFRGIQEYQVRSGENISKLMEELSNNANMQKEVNVHTKMVLEEIISYQQQAAAMNSSLSGNMNCMNEFNEALLGILESEKKSADELNSQRQALQQENSEYFAKMDEQIRRLLDDLSIQLDVAFSRFNDITSMAFERLDQSMNSTVEGVSGNIKTLADNMDDQVRDITIYARGLSEEVGELNSRLENSVKEFGNQINEGVVKTLETFDDSLSEICGRFGRVITDIKDAVEDLPAVMEAMGNNQKDKLEMVK
jgi:phage-related protein